MRHPIFNGSGYKLYALIWSVIMIVHAAVLHLFYGYLIEIAILDSAIFNVIFASIVPAFWYLVKFTSLSKDEVSLIGTHIGAALLIVMAWAGFSEFLLNFFFSSNPDYIKFLSDTYIWRLIIGVLYYSISILIFYLIKYYQDMQERANRELELQNLLKDTELRMLKSQINPHFIFNSLNSISALTVSKPESAREMVIKLSNFLRYSLGKNNVEMNSLKQEIENVSLYLDIEKVRFGDKLKFELNISEACQDVKVPNLILQPLFENAIKYGVYDSLEEVTIQLKCEPQEHNLLVSVINNFDSESVMSKGEGIGLESVRKRLALVYGRSDLLQVESKDNLFNVSLRIPTKTEEHE
jgi:two-component system LytT family sensor kinase